MITQNIYVISYIEYNNLRMQTFEIKFSPLW